MAAWITDAADERPIPGGPAADLVVVQADLALGLLEGLLDRPADLGDSDQVARGVDAGPEHA